jgi:hypothetical protein
MRFTALPLLSLALAALPACGSDDPAEPPDAGPAPRATWYQDVAPIVAQRCMGCHRDGGIAPFSLTDYASAKNVGPVALAAVESGMMPPWDAVDADDCAPRFGWKHDPRLSPAELDTFRAWVEDGMAEGTVADIPDPPDTSLTGITHSVTPAEPYATSGDADEFICYVLDPGVTQLGWMTGLQLTPGNPKVVHHAVTSVMPPGAELDALKQEHPVGQPFECNGGGMFPGSYLLNVWTPGQEPMQTGSDVAIPVQPGAALVVQFHYHPGGIANEPDDTRIDLRLSSTIPRMTYMIGAWGNAFAAPELLAGPNDPPEGPAFYVPREVPDHREHMRFQVVTDSTDRFPLLFAYPHMHYIGVELSVKIERATPRAGEPTSECLVNVDRWDFDWQRTYQYDAAIEDLPTVGNGDIVDVDCTYDNTMDNPFVQRALEELGLPRPIDVFLGEESLDEMCLGIFGIAFEVGAAAKDTVPSPPNLRLVPVAR